MLRKGVYSYEYMDDWETFNEKSLSKKEEFYSNSNLESITDSDSNHAKRICNDYEIKNLGESNELYLKSEILLLSDIFEKKNVLRNL